MTQGSRPLSFSKEAIAARMGPRLRQEEGKSRQQGLRVVALVYALVLAVYFASSPILTAVGATVPAGWKWATVPALAIGMGIGWGLSYCKRKWLARYATAELVFGALSILVGVGKLWHAIVAGDDGGAWTGAIALVGGLYVLSRAFGSRKEAFDKRSGAVREQVRRDWLDAAKSSAAVNNMDEAFENLMKAVEVGER